MRTHDEVIRAKEREIEDLIARQVAANQEISDMMRESKNLVQEVEDRNRALEHERQVLEEKLQRMAVQSEEMRGLMELYKNKYKAEKLSNRQSAHLSER